MASASLAQLPMPSELIDEVRSFLCRLLLESCPAKVRGCIPKMGVLGMRSSHPFQVRGLVSLLETFVNVACHQFSRSSENSPTTLLHPI